MSFWTVTGTQKTLKRRFLRRSLPTLTPSRETGLATKSYLACQWRGPITVINTPWDDAFWLHSMNIEQGCRTSIPWPPWLWLVRCSPHSHWGKTTELEAKLQGTDIFQDFKFKTFFFLCRWHSGSGMRWCGRERRKDILPPMTTSIWGETRPTTESVAYIFPRCFGRVGRGHGMAQRPILISTMEILSFQRCWGRAGRGRLTWQIMIKRLLSSMFLLSASTTKRVVRYWHYNVRLLVS